MKNNVFFKIGNSLNANTSSTLLLIGEGKETLIADFTSGSFLLTLVKFISGVVNKREIVLVTAKSGNALTITRAYEPCPLNDLAIIETQTPQAFDTGDYAYLNTTAGFYTDLQNQINNKQNVLVNQTNIKSINGNSILGSGDLTVTSLSIIQTFIAGENIDIQKPVYVADNGRVYLTNTGIGKFAGISNESRVQGQNINITTAGKYTGIGGFNVGSKYLPGYNWSAKSTSGFTAREYMSSVTNAGIIYCIGGYNGTSRVGTNEGYNISTNTWTTYANKPTSTQQGTAQVYNGVIYYLGGENNSGPVNTVERYTIASNSWGTNGSSTGFTARRLLSSVINAGLIYVMGGYSSGGTSNKLEVYNTTTDAWITKTNLTNAKYSFTSQVYNGIIHTFGGNSGSGVLYYHDKYNITTDTWTSELANSPLAESPTSEINGSNIYIFGGHNGLSLLNSIWKYDITANLSYPYFGTMTSARYRMSSGIYNSKIYLIGGSNGTTIQNINEEYDLNTSTSLSDSGSIKVGIATSSTNLFLGPNIL